MPSPGIMPTDAVSLLHDVKNARNGERVTVFGENKYIFSNYAEVIDFVLNVKNGFYYKIHRAKSLEEILDICTAFDRGGSFVYKVEGIQDIEPDISSDFDKAVLESCEDNPIEVARKDGTVWSISCKSHEKMIQSSKVVEKILEVKKV